MKKPPKSERLFSWRLKFDLKMKFLLLFLITGSFVMQANMSYSQKTKISLEFGNASMAEIIDEIEANTEFKFIFNTKTIDLNRKVSIKVKKAAIERVLELLFGKEGVVYEIDDRKILLTSAITKVMAIKSGQTGLSKPFQFSLSGSVTDQENIPLPGANILEKGTTNGVTADFDGNFYMEVADENVILVVSYLGFATKEIPLNGQTTISISLEESAAGLDEVVVTALGIKQETRKLGYSVSKVDAEDLNVNRSSNVMNALQGKVAGVNISALGTGPGGSSKIRIRGQSSISGTNDPLIVVNGVPIDNSNFASNNGSSGSGQELGNSGGGMYADGGDGFSSINPDDIESMTILKGATGAALYGSRAKDGVIMITTKTRGEGKGIGVTYNLSVSNHTPLDFTDYQYEYGQGENGVRPTSANPTSGQWSFGEKFQPGMTQILFDGLEVPYEPVYGIINDFYRDGLDITNSIGLSGGGDKGGFNLSLSRLKSEGITPNNEFERINVGLGASYDLSSKLSFKTNISYSNEKNTNPPNVGQQSNTIPVALYNMANSMPLDVLEANKYDANGDEFVYSRFRARTNPYWTIAEQFNNILRDRIFGNASLKYDVLPWLFGQIRIGQDYWSRDQEYNGYPTGFAGISPAPEGFFNGTYSQEVRRFRETNVDFLLSGNKTFGNDFGVGLTLGGNKMNRRTDLNRVDVTDFVIRDLYTVQNGRVKDPFYDLSERAVNSLYGSLDLSYDDTFYLNGTLRNDWFSTLSPENRSILYPSVSASYVFSNSFEERPEWLSFGKLRVAYAEVGSDTDVPPYSDALFYNINSNLFSNSNGQLQPVASANTNTLPNPNLKPMRVSESEIGLDLRMFNSRVNLDLSVYRKTTFDQIIPAQISNASSFESTFINSGESQSDGVEVLLNLIPIKNIDFQWDLTLNTSYNKTKVVSLISDTPGESIVVGTHVFNGFLYQVVGEEIGQLAGYGYKFDEQGRQVFGDDGRALRSDDIKFFGSALPKFIGGITNSFRYKDFTASFLIDFKLGGKMISGTNFNAVRHGLHKMTLPGRDTGVIGDGVNLAGQPNTVALESQTYWEVVRNSQIIEPIIYDSGFWKFRQLNIGYNFHKFLPQTSPIKGATLSLFANNLFIIKKWVPNIDPDSFGYSSDNISGLESTGVPTTRSLGFNLNLKF